MSDLAVLIAQEVAKQLPVKDVYNHGLAPATKQAGNALEDLTKCIRLALAPIQYGAVLQDRFRRFIENAAQRVREEDRVSPAPQILGPVLEAIRYEPEGTLSDEAFSRLLSRAFDKERLGCAHPAFPAILRSLSTDEIILVMKLSQSAIKVACLYVNGNQTREIESCYYEENFSFLAYPTNILTYCEHLESQGLVYSLVASQEEGQSPSGDGFFKVFWSLELQNFGRMLAKAALPTSAAEEP